MEKHVHIIDNEKIKEIPQIDNFTIDEMAVLFNTKSGLYKGLKWRKTGHFQKIIFR